MKIPMTRTRFALLALALAAAACRAAAPAPAQRASDDLLGVTCGDYLEALKAADPGRNPTKERAAQAEDAQDDLANGLIWVHGYLTARANGSAPGPLNREWMKATIGRLAKVCRDNSHDGRLRIADAVNKL